MTHRNSASLKLFVLLLPIILTPAIASVGWVGSMFPAGGSSNNVMEGSAFDVYIQVWKNGVTPPMGRGSNIECTLHWGRVNAFGQTWFNVVDSPMSYHGDVGNNDEYKASISPPVGLYEFTAFCTDLTDSTDVWQSQGNGKLTVDPSPADPAGFNAIWTERDAIAWNTGHGPSGVVYELHSDWDGGLVIPSSPGAGVPLTFDSLLSGSSYPKFPNLDGYKKLTIGSGDMALVPDILRSQAAVAVYSSSGTLLESTGIQLPGALDDLYPCSGDLGAVFNGSSPTLKVWAPTAQAITLHLFDDADPATAPTVAPMSFDPASGVWSVTGNSSWVGKYYLYEVQVYAPTTGQVEHNLVTDPYSVSLSQNSGRSQILDLENDPALKPSGWDSLVKPQLDAPEDIVVYEVHLRDFSINDTTVAAADRGKFNAFTYDGQSGRPLSDGMAHLIGLAQAGLTHVHLLPAFDIASVNEDEAARQEPDPAVLASYPPDSSMQQQLVGDLRGLDGFNWGYDPFHYGVPEGSYATQQDGPARILEFREMVRVLAANGLRVVLDVVYNHTSASGQAGKSVLDRIVPGYYHRYDNQGNLQTSSCCSDTASEFAMMEKLMIDTVLRWARAYRIDGFRFDLMNLHTVANMTAVRDAVQSLTPAADGVDGSKIYIYGEGWHFGSALDKGLNIANQFNMAGTGVGTFNDRIRDAVHGGYDTDPLVIRTQGFVNGLSYDWNGHFYERRFRDDLLDKADRIRVAMAGNLQNFTFIDRFDNPNQTGIGFSGAGYALDPQEAVQYVSKHDNETLYDLNVIKAPSANSMAERVRMQNLALSIVGFSQGVPFFHLAGDLLRSKSLDRNSYDSGDWFNAVDFTRQSNNFGVGLPPEWDNSVRWDIMGPLLADPELRPASTDIADMAQRFLEVLEIRRSSKLFRLQTASDVTARVQFHNTGSGQKDGLIAMTISDEVAPDLDPAYERMVVLINANKIAQDLTIPWMAGVNATLHPTLAAAGDPVVLSSGYDAATGTFSVPARTAAVFVSDGTAAGAAVTFNVNATTVWGQNVYVAGNVAQLGSWNTDNAVALSAAAYPIWGGTVDLPASTLIEYKYIKKDGSGNVIWESGSNRTFTTPPAGGTATRDDSWN